MADKDKREIGDALVDAFVARAEQDRSRAGSKARHGCLTQQRPGGAEADQRCRRRFGAGDHVDVAFDRAAGIFFGEGESLAIVVFRLADIKGIFARYDLERAAASVKALLEANKAR